MIHQITIKNFKSVEDLEISLGRVTVLIGENGSGKSNILEAVAMMGAAAAGKLDDEFLVSRGIRTTDESLMLSAFDVSNARKGDKRNERISLSARNQKAIEEFTLSAAKNAARPEWRHMINIKSSDVPQILPKRLPQKVQKEMLKILTSAIKSAPKTAKTRREEVQVVRKHLHEIAAGVLMYEQVRKANEAAEKVMNLGRFLIYAPENSALRRFEEEGQIQPLGIRGEGLFKLLQTFGVKGKKKALEELKSSLELTGWFLDFSIPPNLAPGESRLRIHDRYLGRGIELDQRSANEGFLLLLFYFALFLSEDTPPFFAIDNVDASLNPKLCAALMRRICELADVCGKQVIVTTHNPALLDGLDLADDKEQLYAVYRNEHGRTKVTRVTAPKTRVGEAPLKLSHAFLRGLIGGLPKNF